jgi:hypothetical protein
LNAGWLRILRLSVSICFGLALVSRDVAANSREVLAERLAERPPNILLIVADDLGWNEVGDHGSEIAPPNLDVIAGQGIELDRFDVQPSCRPTRAALITGKSLARLGIERPVATGFCICGTGALANLQRPARTDGSRGISCGARRTDDRNRRCIAPWPIGSRKPSRHFARSRPLCREGRPSPLG